MNLFKIVFCLAALSVGFDASAAEELVQRDASCVEYLRAVAATLKRPELRWDHPSAMLRAKYPGDPNPQWLRSFEDEMVRIYTEVPPDMRQWEDFGRAQGLSADEVLDLRTYYGLNFFNYAGVIDDRPALIAHARRRRLEEFIREQKHPAARHYRYYKDNMARLSVPEMAAALQIPEGAVYRELNFLNLSQEVMFHADEIVPDTQAEVFSLHRAGVKPRRVGWQRLLTFRGAQWREEAILVQLVDEGYKYAEIATELNRLALVESVSSPEIRTEGAVQGKMRVMGLAQKNQIEDDVSIPPYGILKLYGKMLPGPVAEFLMDHAHLSLGQLAGQLGVQEVSLVGFLRREQLTGIIKLDQDVNRVEQRNRRQAFLDEKAAQRLRAKFEENLLLMDRLIDGLAVEGVTKIPPQERRRGDVGPLLSDMLGVPYQRFFGKLIKDDNNLNGSRLEALERTILRLRDRRADFSPQSYAKVEAILSEEVAWMKFAAKSKDEQNVFLQDRLIEELVRDEVTEIPALAAYKRPGKRTIDEVLGVDPSRFFGYKQSNAVPLNDSRVTAMRVTLARLETRKAELDPKAYQKARDLLTAEIDFVDFESLPDPKKNEVLQDRLIAELVREGVTKIPSASSSRNGAPESPLSQVLKTVHSRFYGSGNSGARLNDSRLQALERTLARLESRKSEFEAEAFAKARAILKTEIEDTKFEELPNPEKNRIVMDRLVNELVKEGVNAIPTVTPDKVTRKPPLALVLGISHPRFYGSSSRQNLNASRAEALEGTLKRLETRRVEFEPKAYAKAHKILKDEVEISKFDNLPDAQKNLIVQNRLISYLAQEGVSKMPSGGMNPETGKTYFSEVLGITHGRFVGSAQASLLNASRREALTRTLETLEGREDLSDTAFAKVRVLLEKEIAKSR